MYQLVILILALLGLTSCNESQYGFKKNPVYVLTLAHKSLITENDTAIQELCGKEALCVYGNEEGMSYLKSHLDQDFKDLNGKFRLLKAEHYSIPKYVGYWSYYNEKHLVTVEDKRSNDSLFQALVECDFGTDESKDSKLVNLRPNLYQKKECRITKIMPQTFAELHLPQECEKLKVTL